MRLRRLDISANTVSVQSWPKCANDWSATQFADDIAWMFQTGITTGCLPGGLYCPNDREPRTVGLLPAPRLRPAIDVRGLLHR